MAPFGAVLLVGLALSPSTPLTFLASALAAALLAGMWLAPWTALPAWTQALPFYVALPAIGLLRHVNGGPMSGYAPLALLPVLWLALYFGRRELLLGLAVLAATFCAPLAFGGPGYAGGWRVALLVVLTAGVVGFTIRDLSDQLRDRASDLQAIGSAARELPADDSARAAVCQAAREVSGADFVLLLEPDGRSALHSTAVHGLALQVSVPMAGISVAVDAFLSREPHFVSDCATDPTVSRRLHLETGAVSLFVQPVLRGDMALGVLVLGFSRRLSRVPRRLADSMEVVAAEASLAVDRADLLQRLANAAHSDGLTGAANRRGWDLAVRRDLQPALTAPAVMALLDLDHFKRFNDSFGHQAGDELLQECVRRWSRVLRSGDTLARWGGEEFAVLLPSCEQAPAAAILDRLRACVPDGCTVSAGVTVSLGGEPPAVVMARADAALYAAKHAGRDRAVWHDPSAPVDLVDPAPLVQLAG